MVIWEGTFVCKCKRAHRFVVDVDMEAGAPVPQHLRAFSDASMVTPLELRVLGHVACGLTDRETARRMGISLDRVRHAVRGAIAHLAAKTRAQAVYIATMERLLDEDARLSSVASGADVDRAH